MNGKQKIQSIIAGQQTPTEGYPVGLLLSLYGARLTECPLDRYYSESTAFMAGATAVHKTFAPELLFGPIAVAMEGAAFGSKIMIRKKQAPTLKQPVISHNSRIDSVTCPCIATNPMLCYLRDSVGRLSQRYGESTMIAAIAMDPTALPSLILGTGGWIETLITNPEAAAELMKKTSEHFIAWSNSLFAAGADVVITPVMFATPNIVTRSMLENLILPVMKDAFFQMEGPVIVHHGASVLQPHLDLLEELPNVLGFVIDPRDDPVAARATVHPSQLLLCGLDGPTLHHYSPEEIYEASRRYFVNCDRDSRYIYCTTTIDIDYHAPPECIHAILRCAREHSRSEYSLDEAQTLLTTIE